ncbi:hypothetical protein C8Q80DRAFT_262708 [Daedaleopsis nitida]|nr:hypothetical protein C8Q80DRAFT_262708 [Daedaleopsis nitida]
MPLTKRNPPTRNYSRISRLTTLDLHTSYNGFYRLSNWRRHQRHHLCHRSRHRDHRLSNRHCTRHHLGRHRCNPMLQMLQPWTPRHWRGIQRQ